MTGSKIKQKQLIWQGVSIHGGEIISVGSQQYFEQSKMTFKV